MKISTNTDTDQHRYLMTTVTTRIIIMMMIIIKHLIFLFSER